MTIDNSIVRKVGKLAKIKIKESEENKLLDELNNILGWVDELKKVDTEKNPGLAKLPEKVRNKMGFMKRGGRAMKRGGGMMKKRMKRGGKAK